jgi:threonyl-tRNA synthetase
MITITLPDGSARQVEKGTTAMQVALSISEGLARNVLCAEIDGEVRDAGRPIDSDCRLKLLTWNDDNGKSTLWHSSAHLMAEAIMHFYPEAKLAIGPPIENGFYYDVDFGGKTFAQEDFDKVEKKMLELARQKNAYIREEKSKSEALAYFTERQDPYKLELINDLTDGTITFYTQGGFTDLCRGPHIPDTGFIKAAKLLNVAGAYWRGDEKNKMLTRVYAITFPKQSELEAYLVLLEEAKKRDHRKLGKELELFHFSSRVGQGLPLWLPKGTDLRSRLTAFLTAAQKKAGYVQVITPHIGSKELYETSGHWAKYGADSFRPIETPQEGEVFMLKPMNCPIKICPFVWPNLERFTVMSKVGNCTV